MLGIINKSSSWLHNHLWVVKVAIVFACLCSITACVSLDDPETSQDIHNEVIGILGTDTSIGQTLVSRRPRLSGITFWLRTSENSGVISLEIFSSGSDSEPQYQTTFFPNDGENRIEISPQADPPGQEYYIRLSSPLGGTSVLGRLEDNYSNGSAYIDDSPVPGDISFITGYDYDWKAVVNDLQGLLNSWKTHLKIIFLLVVPGWILLEVTNLKSQFDLGELIGASTGISLAIIPLTMLWTTIFNIQWSGFLVKTITSVLLLVSLLLIIPKIRRITPGVSFPTVSSIVKSPIFHLIIIFLISYFVRFAMIRDFAMPSWVDSIHHSIITREIVNFGGFPDDYLPLIPGEASHYHSGFHSILAALHWLTDLEIPEIMLVSGQILNALIVFGVYSVSKTLVGDNGSSVSAALITGLLSGMPAYYASWGRYTQLTGLLVLPIAFRLSILAHKNIKRKSFWILGTVTIGGLFMIHYRVTIFLGLLLAAFWTASLYKSKKKSLSLRVKSILSAITIGLSAILLVLPWFVPTIQSYAIPIARKSLTGRVYLQEIHWSYLTSVYGIPNLIIAGLGLIMGIYKRKRFSINLLVWVLLLFVFANTGYFRIPFPAGFINQISVEIILFIPISILSGFILNETWHWIKIRLPSKWESLWLYLSIIGCSLAVLFGARKMLPILNTNTALFRQSDQKSIEWIEENIPLDETIVVNPTGWGYGLYMGRDGGYWISPITRHQTMPPNVLYGTSKKDRESVNAFVEALLPIGGEPDQIWALCQENNFKYIYVGTKGGIISPGALAHSPLFEILNQQQNNWVFEIINIQ